MKDLFTVGEPMVVFSSDDIDVELSDVLHFSTHLAGAELNVAIGVSKLGLSVDYMSSVGSDSFGDYIIKHIAAQGISTEHIKRDAKFSTGIYFKEGVSSGDPNILYMRANSAAANISAEILDSIDMNDYKVAHLTGIFPAISQNAQNFFYGLLQKLRNSSARIVFDPNLRPKLWDSEAEMVRYTNKVASLSNVILPGIGEGKVLLGTDDPETIARFYLDQSPTTDTVIVKLGEEGALLATGGTFEYIKGFAVDKVVSTVGAGDGFAVGYISGIIEGLSAQDAVKRACAIGALAVTTPGDNDGYPTRAELEKFMA